MKVASVCLAVAAATLFAVVLGTEVGDPATVRLGTGMVKGAFDAATSVWSWKGVPYGESTAGPNRFQPPRRRSAWTGVRDATQWGPGCYQYKVNADAPKVQSEDCLHVNVFTPGTAAGVSKNLPVVVWIHGGGFMEGSNIGPYQVYDGRYVAHRVNCVVITINYRLGSLGFLVGGNIMGNFGFLDQQLALQWVKDNAAAFGGDILQVTLWGESAGAMSIGLHMIAPASAGLFHRAIQESNPLAITYKTTAAASVLGLDTCKRVGCAKCDLTCMQHVPIDKLMAESKAAAGSTLNTIEANYKHILGALLDFTPTVDGRVIPGQVITTMKTGAWRLVPLITGTNLQEGQTFVYEALTKPIPMTNDLEKLAVKGVLALLWPSHPEDMIKSYSMTTDTDAREVLSRMVTDFLFTCPSQQFAMAVNRYSPQRAWVYQYRHVFSIPSLFTGLIPDRCATAVCHATELPIVFHNGPTSDQGKVSPLSAAENALSDAMIDYFANFIYYGNPNGNPKGGGVKVLRPWDTFDPKQRNAIVFGDGANIVNVNPAYFADTCKRWDQIGYGVGELFSAPASARFRAVNANAEEADVEEEDELETEDADELDAEGEAEGEAEADEEDEADAESDAELDAEDAEEMEEFVEDEAEAERYEFADA